MMPSSFGVLLPPNENAEHFMVLSSFAQGVSKHGVQLLISDQVSDLVNCEVAVIFGMFKKKVPSSYNRGLLFNLFRQSNKNVVVIDSGYIQRHKYYMVGLNGLNGRARFAHPADGIRAINNGSYLNLKPWRKDGEHVLLVGQVPWDASVEGTNHIQWIDNTINTFKTIDNKRELRFRPHPMVGIEAYTRWLPMQGNVTISKSPSLDDDLKNCWAVITYTSNVGVDAVLNGIPVFTADDGSMVRDISNKEFPMGLSKPDVFERGKWLRYISYAQWTVEEMRKGECLENLSSIL